MFRIYRIHSAALPREREIVAHVQDILKEQFPLIADQDLQSVADHLHDPLKYRFRTVLFVADKGKGPIQGFALLMHSPDLHFSFLDYIAVSPGLSSRGIGGALYHRVRQEARNLGSTGIFMECLPDELSLCRDPSVIKQNAARLKFYEHYGARPIVNTEYELPIKDTDLCPPHLVYDNLGLDRPLARDTARRIVRAILERHYGAACPPGYIDRVVDSFRDDPVVLRAPRYVKAEAVLPVATVVPEDQRVVLVVTDRHQIHHVRERGYLEAPARISSILKEIEGAGFFRRIPIRHFAERHIRAAHDADFVDYLERVGANIGPGESVYPYVFPLRNIARRPLDLPVRAGYYCIDTFTPLNRNAYDSAKRAVDCALTAADSLFEASRLAYALVRPPGHHAERRSFGGFCYFNSAAIAAQYLARQGRVAMLDIDYHHGNGAQNIFYERDDVFTVSLHAHPRFAYPYFSGFEDERGKGPGEGHNLNIPLPESVDGAQYRSHLQRALNRIVKFAPLFLVVALGLDPARGDPTGSWSLTPKDFEENGVMIGRLSLPTLVVQEGGYRSRNLGVNARRFFTGLWKGAFGAPEAAT